MERVLTSGTKKAPSHTESAHPSLLCFHHPVSSIIIFLNGPCVCVVPGGVNDMNVTLSEQRSKAGGSETKAVICGGRRPAALPGGRGAGVLRKGKCPPLGKRQKYGHQSSHICSTRPTRSISDGVVRSVSLSNQCLGENEERQRCRELPSSDAGSVPFPSQWAEELHPRSSEHRRGAGSMYVLVLGGQTHSFTAV